MSVEPGKSDNRGTKKSSKGSRIWWIIIGVIALLFVLRQIDKLIGGIF
jgi:hypothetical protein